MPHSLSRCRAEQTLLFVFKPASARHSRVERSRHAARPAYLFAETPRMSDECAAMTDLRGQFPDIFQPQQTMQQFMWQPNLLQVAKFLDAGMKRLQTVDPDEGSNI